MGVHVPQGECKVLGFWCRFVSVDLLLRRRQRNVFSSWEKIRQDFRSANTLETFVH